MASCRVNKEMQFHRAGPAKGDVLQTEGGLRLDFAVKQGST